MSARSASRLALHLQARTAVSTEPLLPSLAAFNTSVAPVSKQQHRCFRGDRNRNRGVSVLRRSGLRPRQTLSVKKVDLPVPVLDPTRRSKVEVDNNHGLWQFFNPTKKLLSTPEEASAHGRSWTVQELRRKSWEDLHRLWWVCVKERNRLSTETYERNRLNAGYGDYEADERDKTVKHTMRAIKHTLSERWYAWENAREDALKDPEVDMSGEGPAYKPVFEVEPLEAEEVVQEVPKKRKTGRSARRAA